jgi:hypothetical protein
MLFVAVFSVQATEITTSVQTSTFAFDNQGNLNPLAPLYGVSVGISEQIMDQLSANLAFDNDPVLGNMFSARALYRAPFMEISAGPSFGVLNSSGNSHAVPVLVQPGLGIGFAVTIPGILVTKADTEFSLPPPASSSGQVFLQKSELSAGVFLPHVLCSVGVSQKTNTNVALTETRIKSITDYGLYTESFKKGSPFRVAVNFIYRISDYFIADSSPANRKIGNLVLGGGVTWAPKDDFSLFADGNGALYSFSLGDKVSGLSNFFFDLKLGARIRTDALNKTGL